jgi:predicted  nucleic acid-binding Zn-ribbon protein
MAKAETLSTRVTRLEDLARVLLDAQIKTEQTILALRVESNEREKRMDERVDKLVSVIGVLIGHLPPFPPAPPAA